MPTTTPNMGLTAPGIGDAGPTWANEINTDLTTVDQHDHSPGNGARITPLGINVSSDLAFNAHKISGAAGVIFTKLGADPTGAGNNDQLYNKNGSLYWRDDNGNITAITPPSPVTLDEAIKYRSAILLQSQQFSYLGLDFILDAGTTGLAYWTASGTSYSCISGGNDSSGEVQFLITGASHAGFSQLRTGGGPIVLGTGETFTIHWIFKVSTTSAANTKVVCCGLTDGFGTGYVSGIGLDSSNTGNFRFMDMNSSGTVVSSLNTGVALDSNWHLFTIYSNGTKLWYAIDGLAFVDVSTQFRSALNLIGAIPAHSVRTGGTATSVTTMLQHLGIAIPQPLQLSLFITQPT